MANRDYNPHGALPSDDVQIVAFALNSYAADLMSKTRQETKMLEEAGADREAIVENIERSADYLARVQVVVRRFTVDPLDHPAMFESMMTEYLDA